MGEHRAPIPDVPDPVGLAFEATIRYHASVIDTDWLLQSPADDPVHILGSRFSPRMFAASETLTRTNLCASAVAMEAR